MYAAENVLWGVCISVSVYIIGIIYFECMWWMDVLSNSYCNVTWWNENWIKGEDAANVDQAA